MARNRHPDPIHTKALDQLYALMRDGNVAMRTRLDSAIRASRVEPLELPGTTAPPAVLFLRNVMTFKYEGKQYSGILRSKAGAALAYFERRSALAALKYNVADDSERVEGWRRVINGLLRRHLVKAGRWPQDQDLLLGPDEPFEMPPYAPETGLSALLIANPRQRRRIRNIDEPESPVITSQSERDAVLRAIAQLMQARLAQAPAAA